MRWTYPASWFTRASDETGGTKGDESPRSGSTSSTPTPPLSSSSGWWWPFAASVSSSSSSARASSASSTSSPSLPPSTRSTMQSSSVATSVPADSADNSSSFSSSSQQPNSSVHAGSPKSTPVQVARGLYDFLHQVGGQEYDKTSMLADFAIGLGVLIDHKEKQRRANFARDMARLEQQRCVLPAEELVRLQHYARLAHGSYCTSERELFANTPLYEGMVKKARWSSTQDRPAYFVAVDEVYRAVVVSVRGTDAISDVFTDLSLHPVPFLGGHAHSGMVHSALSLYDEVHDTLRALHREYPDHQLVFTGHSLGGGVASLLALKMYLESAPDSVNGAGAAGRCNHGRDKVGNNSGNGDNAFNGSNRRERSGRTDWLGGGGGSGGGKEAATGRDNTLRHTRTRDTDAADNDVDDGDSSDVVVADWHRPLAYTFAAPACVSADLAARATGHDGVQHALTHVVLGDDLVPRACAASIDRVVRELAAFDWPHHMTKDMVSRVSETRLAQWSREYFHFSVDRHQVSQFMREVSSILGKSGTRGETESGGSGSGSGGGGSSSSSSSSIASSAGSASSLANGNGGGATLASRANVVANSVRGSIASSTRLSKVASVASAASGILNAYNKYMDSKEKHQQQQQRETATAESARASRAGAAASDSNGATAAVPAASTEQKLPQYLLPPGRLFHLVAAPVSLRDNADNDATQSDGDGGNGDADSDSQQSRRDGQRWRQPQPQNAHARSPTLYAAAPDGEANTSSALAPDALSLSRAADTARGESASAHADRCTSKDAGTAAIRRAERGIDDNDGNAGDARASQNKVSRVLVRVAHANEFNDIVLSRNCIGDHLMRNIRRALALSECE